MRSRLSIGRDCLFSDAIITDLFPTGQLRRILKKHGENIVLKSKSKKFGEFRYDFYS